MPNMDSRRVKSRQVSSRPIESTEGPKRKVVRWNETDDQLLLIAVWTIIKEEVNNFPWDKVGEVLGTGASGGAVDQHIAKIRKLREEARIVVPRKAVRKHYILMQGKLKLPVETNVESNSNVIGDPSLDSASLNFTQDITETCLIDDESDYEESNTRKRVAKRYPTRIKQENDIMNEEDKDVSSLSMKKRKTLMMSTPRDVNDNNMIVAAAMKQSGTKSKMIVLRLSSEKLSRYPHHEICTSDKALQTSIARQMVFSNGLLPGAGSSGINTEVKNRLEKLLAEEVIKSPTTSKVRKDVSGRFSKKPRVDSSKAQMPFHKAYSGVNAKRSTDLKFSHVLLPNHQGSATHNHHISSATNDSNFHSQSLATNHHSAGLGTAYQSFNPLGDHDISPSSSFGDYNGLATNSVSGFGGLGSNTLVEHEPLRFTPVSRVNSLGSSSLNSSEDLEDIHVSSFHGSYRANRLFVDSQPNYEGVSSNAINETNSLPSSFLGSSDGLSSSSFGSYIDINSSGGFDSLLSSSFGHEDSLLPSPFDSFNSLASSSLSGHNSLVAGDSGEFEVMPVNYQGVESEHVTGMSPSTNSESSPYPIPQSGYSVVPDRDHNQILNGTRTMAPYTGYKTALSDHLNAMLHNVTKVCLGHSTFAALDRANDASFDDSFGMFYTDLANTSFMDGKYTSATLSEDIGDYYSDRSVITSNDKPVSFEADESWYPVSP